MAAADNRARVALMLREGRSVLEIAHALKISPQAVYKHKKAIVAEGRVSA